MNNTEKDEKNIYDEEPVYYCKRCLSLNIRSLPMIGNQDYCEECGAIDIGTTEIDNWNKMYEAKYGHPYIIKKEKKWPYWC